MTKPILRSKPQRASDVVFRSVSRDTVLLDLESGYYFSLNPLGSEIWQRCDGQTEVAKLVEDLYAQYAASREQLEADVVGFIEQMLSEGLLRVDADTRP